ncbi:hypothetical protein HMPREF0083_03260 [Aneurinibacillus aneurinilyticus ATCC 12856]|uniref:Uncharacterized protein n=1 Tax=Aneurinibacillus aneurinilyticus ATCC 12856 TaxID=649747 RepID=U1X129_ANEAE|nr:hypothetical protein HMPREF0083_03260 [Aneurinibacillus aneurinilyticus ATCC 12856]
MGKEVLVKKGILFKKTNYYITRRKRKNKVECFQNNFFIGKNFIGQSI